MGTVLVKYKAWPERGTSRIPESEFDPDVHELIPEPEDE